MLFSDAYEACGIHSKLSIIIPCFNEQKTLERCVHRVRKIASDCLALEIIIVDDDSTDESLAIARRIEMNCPEVSLLTHERNEGKGAALRTGFSRATGEFIAIQDADLEYDPLDLRELLVPLVSGDADMVLGSRFLLKEPRRGYFWHTIANRLITFASNLFTGLKLTDVETCYKVFHREMLQAIEIKEPRFGVELEFVAKIAQLQLRIRELGISYQPRTYGDGKKIGMKDAFRALYCILRYNIQVPTPIREMFSENQATRKDKENKKSPDNSH
jgi:glycosyltransferase involved in cell wall biosynthesis